MSPGLESDNAPPRSVYMAGLAETEYARLFRLEKGREIIRRMPPGEEE